jgi:hypothetical protein
MQDLSFDFNDPTFRFNSLQFSIQVFTFKNVYGLSGSSCQITETQEQYRVDCEKLTWAGAQDVVEGHVSVVAVANGQKTTFQIAAGCAQTIRCVKLVLRGMPDGDVVNLRETPRKVVPPEGLMLHYPSGWRDLYAPLVILEATDHTYTYVRSLDPAVREKRFALLPKNNALDIELIFEEDATTMLNTVAVPPWEVGTCSTPEDMLGEHMRHVERIHHLVPWEARQDVPAWAKQIALIAAIHCQHWTGYKFNDYARVLDTIQWLAHHMPAEQILVYLPGWEGRYYWQYGDYRPDNRMGGTQSFAALMEGARNIGVHMMPMFGINVVNRSIENFEQWGAPAITSRAGGVPGAGSVDWDGSRHYDHESLALLNPGAPTWQNRLVTQITELIDTYHFDAVFLDISAAWLNDPRYNTYDGVVRLVQRIRERQPNVLVAGEGWYDLIGVATPLVQSGHSDGVLHWHDEPYAALFDTYNRSFAHLCLGDPGRGSTGVHELGYNPIWRSPLRKGIIPTLTIVEDTLERAPGRVMQILDDAKQYAALYLPTD